MAGEGVADSTLDNNLDLVDAGSNRFSLSTKIVGGSHILQQLDYANAVAMGLVEGHTVNTMFGRNLDIDTGVAETVWDYGGQETYLTADTELFLSSTSAADTDVNITIFGMTEDYVNKTTTVNFTSGQSQQSVGNWFRIFRMVLSIGTNAFAGDMFIAESDTLTAGEPDTPAKVHDKIAFDSNVSHKAACTVPANHTLYINRLFLATRKAEDAVFHFHSRPEGYPAFIEVSNFPVYQSTLFESFSPPFVITEKVDFEFAAVTSTNNTEVVCNIGYTMVDDSV